MAKRPAPEVVLNCLSAPPEVRSRSVGTVRTANGDPVLYSGEVDDLLEGYCFVRLTAFNTDVFSHRTEFAQGEWERLSSRTPVVCNLAFSMRGPCAIRVRIAS